jgi:hypothetical protein
VKDNLILIWQILEESRLLFSSSLDLSKDSNNFTFINEGENTDGAEFIFLKSLLLSKQYMLASQLEEEFQTKVFFFFIKLFYLLVIHF